jgi:hypothetical protein
MTINALETHIDHLVFAARTLDEGVAWCEATLGLTPNAGGEHEKYGTHNRLFKIATPSYPMAYFEIIAINPAASAHKRNANKRWFDLDDAALQASIAKQPALIHFVVNTTDIQLARNTWKAQGLDAGPAVHAHRRTGKGMLNWQITVRDDGQRLFDGTLHGWRENDGARGHWVPQDWVLAYDGHGDMLWNERELRDFELICDWRWTGKPVKAKVPVIRPDGTTPVGDDGKQQMVEIDDFGDSGIYLRGSDKSQVNIWCWPIGSGEVYGYRNDPTQPAAVRAGVTPKEKADAAPGKWNRFRIRMQGDRLTVNLNGKTVIENAQMPGVPAKGPIALQHHGAPIEFANIYVRELKPEAPKSE